MNLNQLSNNALGQIDGILKLFDEQSDVPTKDRIKNNFHLGEVCEAKNVQVIGHHSPAHMFLLKNAFLLGKDAIVLTADGIPVHETTNYSHLRNLITELLPQNIALGDIPILAGDYLPLNGYWSTNFWHWMMDYLPKLVLAELMGFTGYYILPAQPPSFIWESMSMLGIQENRQVLSDNGWWRIERLFVPQQISGGSNLGAYPTLIETLRSRLLRHAQSTSHNFHERVYLTRNQPGLERTIVNDTALQEVLQPFNFTTITMEEKSLAEQIAIMSNVQVLIGPHGAGFVHCLFMPTDSLVLELFSARYVNACMLPVIEQLRHRYYMIVNNDSADEPNNHGKHIIAHTRLVEITLRRELAQTAVSRSS